jgi:hypothetical protein
MAKEMIALGFQFVTLLADNALLTSAARDVVAQMRDGHTASAQPKSAY